MTFVTAIAASAAAVIIAAAQPAGAEEPAFAYRAYELQSPAGVEAVYARLTRLSKRACSQTGRRGLWEARIEEACAERLASDLVAKIGDAALSARHASDPVFIARR